MYITFSHSSVVGHLGYFQVLAVTHCAAINIDMHILFSMFASLCYNPREGIAESQARSLSKLRVFLTSLHRVWTHLHSHQQCWRVPKASPTLIISILSVYYSHRSEGIYHCCLSSHFSDSQLLRAFLHVSVDLLDLLFGEYSVAPSPQIWIGVIRDFQSLLQSLVSSLLSFGYYPFFLVSGM